MFILAQILGLFALIVACIGYFLKDKKKFLITQIIVFFFYALSFLTLKAYVAGVTTLIGIIRCAYIYWCEHKNFKYTMHTMPIFIILYALTGVLFLKNWLDIIPIITASIFSFSYAMKDMQKLRYSIILPNAILVGYCFINKAYTNGIYDFIETLSIIVAIIKFHKESKI